MSANGPAPIRPAYFVRRVSPAPRRRPPARSLSRGAAMCVSGRRPASPFSGSSERHNPTRPAPRPPNPGPSPGSVARASSAAGGAERGQQRRRAGRIAQLGDGVGAEDRALLGQIGRQIVALGCVQRRYARRHRPSRALPALRDVVAEPCLADDRTSPTSSASPAPAWRYRAGPEPATGRPMLFQHGTSPSRPAPGRHSHRPLKRNRSAASAPAMSRIISANVSFSRS